MEATKNITAKERKFIAAVEAHRDAEGKVIAWDICANGNGKVIFENATKDRYSCAYVIDMEGGYFLSFVGERAGHPYDRKTYKRKGNALKGFQMQEGHNEPPTFAATPTETSRISTETAETVNVSAEGENAAERAENKPTSADVAQMVKTELAKNKAMRTAWHLEFPDGTECDVRYKNTVAGCDFYDYSERNGKIERFRDYPAVVSDITLYICQALGIDALEPPQSPEAPQRVECTAEPCKLAQTA